MQSCLLATLAHRPHWRWDEGGIVYSFVCDGSARVSTGGSLHAWSRQITVDDSARRSTCHLKWFPAYDFETQSVNVLRIAACLMCVWNDNTLFALRCGELTNETPAWFCLSPPTLPNPPIGCFLGHRKYRPYTPVCLLLRVIKCTLGVALTNRTCGIHSFSAVSLTFSYNDVKLWKLVMQPLLYVYTLSITQGHQTPVQIQWEMIVVSVAKRDVAVH